MPESCVTLSEGSLFKMLRIIYNAPILPSTIADVKQCTLDGEADHILAARLLQRFTGKRPWIHVDLSAHSCKGGLGAVGTDATGFGVGDGVIA